MEFSAPRADRVQGLLSKVINAENRMIAYMRRVATLLPSDVAESLNVTPPADLSYSSSIDAEAATPSRADMPRRSLASPSPRVGRLQSNSSTTPLWSGEENANVSPLSR